MSRNQSADKNNLLDKLAKTPIVEAACKQIGLPRSTYYRWRKDDQIFAEACDEAIEQSSSMVNDLAESQLINAIKSQNMTAIMFWLKHHHRNYRTRVEVEASIGLNQDELTPEQIETVSRALTLTGLMGKSDEQKPEEESPAKNI